MEQDRSLAPATLNSLASQNLPPEGPEARGILELRDLDGNGYLGELRVTGPEFVGQLCPFRQHRSSSANKRTLMRL